MTLANPRRQFIRNAFVNAGASMAVLHLLEGRVEALPKSEETDIAILNAALGLEHEAIGLYADALARNLVPTGLREYAVEFKGAHEGHRDTQVEILRERGVTAVAPHKVDPIREAAAGDAVIRRLLSVEAAAESAYLRLIGHIRTNDYLLSAGFIVVDEARHQTIWRRARGLSIY
jgi:Ferritin-like domain